MKICKILELKNDDEPLSSRQIQIIEQTTLFDLKQLSNQQLFDFGAILGLLNFSNRCYSAICLPPLQFISVCSGFQSKYPYFDPILSQYAFQKLDSFFDFDFQLSAAHLSILVQLMSLKSVLLNEFFLQTVKVEDFHVLKQIYYLKKFNYQKFNEKDAEKFYQKLDFGAQTLFKSQFLLKVNQIEFQEFQLSEILKKASFSMVEQLLQTSYKVQFTENQVLVLEDVETEDEDNFLLCLTILTRIIKNINNLNQIKQIFNKHSSKIKNRMNFLQNFASLVQNEHPLLHQIEIKNQRYYLNRKPFCVNTLMLIPFLIHLDSEIIFYYVNYISSNLHTVPQYIISDFLPVQQKYPTFKNAIQILTMQSLQKQDFFGYYRLFKQKNLQIPFLIQIITKIFEQPLLWDTEALQIKKFHIDLFRFTYLELIGSIFNGQEFNLLLRLYLKLIMPFLQDLHFQDITIHKFLIICMFTPLNTLINEYVKENEFVKQLVNGKYGAEVDEDGVKVIMNEDLRNRLNQAYQWTIDVTL